MDSVSHAYLMELVTAERDRLFERYQSLVQAYADFGDKKMDTPFIGWDRTPHDCLTRAKREYYLAEQALVALTAL